MHFLQEGAVESLCNPVFLGSVMRGKSSLNSLQIQVVGKLIAEVLSASIGAKLFYFDAMLSVHPSLECQIGLEHVFLECQWVYASVLGIVISEADVIQFSAEGLDWGWSPHVH